MSLLVYKNDEEEDNFYYSGDFYFNSDTYPPHFKKDNFIKQRILKGTTYLVMFFWIFDAV